MSFGQGDCKHNFYFFYHPVLLMISRMVFWFIFRIFCLWIIIGVMQAKCQMQNAWYMLSDLEYNLALGAFLCETILI